MFEVNFHLRLGKKTLSWGKTEQLHPLSNWLSIKTGDLIVSRAGNVRYVVDSHGGFVTLENNSGTTVYVPCDRYNFIPCKLRKRKKQQT
jgi:hypothetical protein